MPSIPLPQNVPIERAGWNTDFNGNVQLPNNERTPVNPIMSGLSQASQQAQTALQGAQAANQVTDVQKKQNEMQASMLAGLAKLPPDQYDTAKAHIIPMINQLGSRQFDPNLDQQTAGLIAGGGVTASEQATLANNLQRAQLMMNMRAQHIEKDPMTGQNVVINSLTGEQRPVTPQESEYYNATGQMPGDQSTGMAPPQNNNGMLFAPQSSPQPSNAVSQLPPAMQKPPIPPVFGFQPSATTSLENNKNIDLTKQWQAADQANRPLFQNMQDKISKMQDVIPNIGGGSTLANLAVSGGQLYGSDAATNAKLLDSQANDLAQMATQLQGTKTGSRGSVLQLKTMLASKPSSTQYPENNKELLDEMSEKVARADADSALYNAYIEANPLHTIDNNAYKLADALDKRFLTDPKTGKPQYTPEGLKAWKDAIPDALQNPQQYIGKKTAASELPANMQSKQAGGKPPEGAPDNAKQGNDGGWYTPDPARPGKYLKW